MEIQVDQVDVRGPHGVLLPPTSLTISSGQLTLVRGEPGGGHTELGLVITGRLRPSSGTVTPDSALLRDISALVDAPGVTAPEDNLTLADVVAEELALHGLRGKPGRWLAERGLDEHTRNRMESLPAAVRTRVLTELAAARPRTTLLVLDQPDRHTGNTQAWWPLALRYAERGYAVVVLCSTSAARLLPIQAAQLGRHVQPQPLMVGVS